MRHGLLQIIQNLLFKNFNNMFVGLFVILLVQILTRQCEKIDEPTVTYGSEWVSDITKYLHKQYRRDSVPNHDHIADVWFSCPANKRLSVEFDYNNTYSGDSGKGAEWYPLASALQFNSLGSLDELYESSLVLPEELLARTVRNSITGKLKEMGAIEEVVCANDKQMKDAIAKEFKEEFQDPIEDQLAKFREDDKEYTHVLTTYCWRGLSQEKKITPQNVEKEAKALRDINPESNKDDFKKKLFEYLDKYSEPDLQKIFRKYRQGLDGINDAVDKAFEVERQKRIVNTLVRYIEDTCHYYADQLKTAFEGCGADIRRINRVVLTRCERDLKCVLKRYKEIFGVEFLDRLKSETPTEERYRRAIGVLCGQPTSFILPTY